MKQKRQRSSIKRLLYLIVFLVIMAIGLFAVGLQMKWWSFGSNLIKIDVFKTNDTSDEEFSIGYGNHDKIVTSQGVVVSYVDGFLEWVNTKGDVVQRSNVKLDSPILKATGQYILAAELKGNKVEVYKGKKLIWHVEIEDSILNADINESGYVTIVRKYTGYKSSIEVYNNKGTKRFYATRANNMIINASVLSDNRTVAINSLFTDGCSLETQLEFYDLELGKVLKMVSLDNKLYYKIQPLSNSKVAIGGSDNVSIFNKKGKVIFAKDYTYVQAMAALNKNMIVVTGIPMGKPKASGHIIQFVTDEGQIKNTLDIGTSIKQMIANDSIVVVSLGRKALILNMHGAILGSTTLNAEIISMHYLSSGKIIIVTNDTIKVCKY